MLESLIKVIKVITHMVQGYTHVTTDQIISSEKGPCLTLTN